MEDRERLIQEISGLMQQLSKEDLLQVKHQISVFIYNSTVEEMQSSSSSSEEEVPPKEKEKKKSTKSEPPRPRITIDHKEGSTAAFISTERKERIFFTVQEIAVMLDICERADNARLIPGKMYRWLEKERRDFLNETGITSSSDPHMKELCLEILEKWGE